MIKMIGKVVLAIVILFGIYFALASAVMIFFIKPSNDTYYTHSKTSKFGINEFDINASKYDKYKYNGILFVPRLKLAEHSEYPETYLMLYSENKKTIHIDYIIRGKERINIDRNITINKKIEGENLYTTFIVLEQRSALSIKELDKFFKEDKMNISVYLKNKNINFVISKKSKTFWYLTD